MKEIDKFKHYVYSNKDISKMVEEKSRFRKAPINYAMTKNELMKEIVGKFWIRKLISCDFRKLQKMKKIKIEKMNYEKNSRKQKNEHRN